MISSGNTNARTIEDGGLPRDPLMTHSGTRMAEGSLMPGTRAMRMTQRVGRNGIPCTAEITTTTPEGAEKRRLEPSSPTLPPVMLPVGERARPSERRAGPANYEGGK